MRAWVIISSLLLFQLVLSFPSPGPPYCLRMNCPSGLQNHPQLSPYISDLCRSWHVPLWSTVKQKKKRKKRNSCLRCDSAKFCHIREGNDLVKVVSIFIWNWVMRLGDCLILNEPVRYLSFSETLQALLILLLETEISKFSRPYVKLTTSFVTTHNKST